VSSIIEEALVLGILKWGANECAHLDIDLMRVERLS